MFTLLLYLFYPDNINKITFNIYINPMRYRIISYVYNLLS